VQHKEAFELPAQVANSDIAGKNEVAIEFTPSPSLVLAPASRRAGRGSLLRPGKSKKPKGSDAGSGGEETDVDEEGNEISAAEAMHNLIKQKADIGAAVGDSIVVFEDVLVLTPRGRFARVLPRVAPLVRQVDRLPCTVQLDPPHLPPAKLDDLHIQLVLGLDPPIRQGATRYPSLSPSGPRTRRLTPSSNLDDEEIAKYPDLQKKYEAPTFQVISRVLKSLTGKKDSPGRFRNAQGVNSLKANVKAVQGELYFLEGSHLHRQQPILIDFSKTESISFSRVGSGVASARNSTCASSPRRTARTTCSVPSARRRLAPFLSSSPARMFG
jgi:structure-specific recognition protein 1